MERHEWLNGRPDVWIGYWTAAEWGDLEQLHQQHHRQQQQHHQLRQQQHQQRQKRLQYRQQLQQHQQYYLQQQHEIFRREQHQQHYRQQQQQQHYQLETAKRTSKAQVEARADGEEAPAKIGSAPPCSQTTLKPQSLSEHSAMALSMSQLAFRENRATDDVLLENMENGLLQKAAQKEEEEKLEELVEESERPQQSMQAAQMRPCPQVEGAGGDEMGVLGKELVVAGCRTGVEEQPPPFWEDSDLSVWWAVPGETELETGSSIAQMRLPTLSSDNTFGGRDVDHGTVVVGYGSLVLEDGEQAPPPLLQQQQKLPAPTPQEPWSPPIMAPERGSGAGSCGESRLELEGGSIAGSFFLFGCESGGLGGGGLDSDRPDGNAWERAGIGTGARSRAFWECEVA